MHRQTILAGSFLALASGIAAAADLPNRAAPPVYVRPAPAFTWTGFYAGINAGYSFSNSGATATTGTPAFLALGPAFVPGSLNTKSDGFAGGGQIGYNYQYGNYVIGVEGDLDYIDQKKSARFTSAGAVLGTTLTTSASKRLDYLGTARLRLGFTPAERWLVYATGGLAFGEVKTGGSVVANNLAGVSWLGSKSSTKTGYALGGGVEYAFTDNITVKGEYLYYDLGKQSTYASGNGGVRAIPALNGVDYASRTKTAGSLVRVGLNYKF